jgi:hypothetical protein
MTTSRTGLRKASNAIHGLRNLSIAALVIGRGSGCEGLPPASPDPAVWLSTPRRGCGFR